MAAIGDPDSMTKSNDGQANGSPIPRSETPYPYFSLPEAIKVGEAVQKAGGNSATERELAVALGLSSTQSRGWSYRISSAREFGLIERTGRGSAARIQITDLFMTYAHPGSDAEKRAALMQMMMKPTLYSSLLARYRGAPKPDATGLANVLWREYRLLESVKLDAAKAFLASAEFAGVINNGLISPVAQPISPTTTDAGSNEEKVDKPPHETQPKAGTQSVVVPADYIIYRCKISGGRVIEVPLPRDFTTSDAEKMYAFLKTQVDDEAKP